MKILLAPDKFKGTLDAPAVAAAMAEGVRAAVSRAEVTMHPLADGGEGTLECLASCGDGRFREIDACDAFGAPVRARVYDSGAAAMVAMHETSSLPRRPTPSAALRASSRGTGMAIARARALFSAREIVVWVGGSASTDGGAGAAGAIGFRLLDRRGRDLPPGGGALRALARIVPPDDAFGGRVTGACDVDSPLLGAGGAARTFSPQKGAGDAEVAVLEAGLEVLAQRIRDDLGIDVAGVSHAGAGGGMGAGLAAFFGARLVDGFGRVAVETGFERHLHGADLVVTGEGRVDAGTLRGKVTAKVAGLCASRGIPCLVVAGEVRLPLDRLPAAPALGVLAVASAVDECGRAKAFEDPAGSVRIATGRLLARTIGAGPA